MQVLNPVCCLLLNIQYANTFVRKFHILKFNKLQIKKIFGTHAKVKTINRALALQAQGPEFNTQSLNTHTPHELTHACVCVNVKAEKWIHK